MRKRPKLTWRNFNWGMALTIILCILMWTGAIGTCVTLQGCSINSSTEEATAIIKIEAQTVRGVEIKEQYIPIKWEAEDWQGQVLYWSKYNNRDRRTPFASNEVSGFENSPDANSIEVVGELGKNVLIKALVP